MKQLCGTRTEQNLLKAFAGESQARNRYTYFAGQARKDGYIAIAQLFEKIADQEKEHAKCFFKCLEGNMVEITASFPAGKINNTQENLNAAANGEKEEAEELYPAFAQTARDEGFLEIAELFENICIAEKAHEKQYRHYLDAVKKGEMFIRETPTTWRCLNCGFVHIGKEAPEKCPACAHPQSYFTAN